MTLAVTGVPDSHRSLVFLAGPDGQRVLPWRVFVGSRTDFVISVGVSVASAGVLTLADLWPAGTRKPQGGTPLPPPLATSLVLVA